MEQNLMYIGEYAPKNIMQAAVTQEPTPECIHLRHRSN